MGTKENVMGWYRIYGVFLSFNRKPELRGADPELTQT